MKAKTELEEFWDGVHAQIDDHFKKNDFLILAKDKNGEFVELKHKHKTGEIVKTLESNT